MILGTSKAKAPDAANVKGLQKNTSKRHFSKSTATVAQYRRIVHGLRRRPHTSYQLMRAGVYHPPSRIFELKRMGFVITKTPVTVVDSEGYSHAKVALYSLDAEPENADALIGGAEIKQPRPSQGDLFGAEG